MSEMPQGRLLDIEDEFRKALQECKELYRTSGFEIAQYHPELIQDTPHEFMSRMLDLHRGLVIKIFVAIAHADGPWTPEEVRLGADLLEHAWGERLEGRHLEEALGRILEEQTDVHWEIETGQELQQLAGHHAEVTSVVFAPDGWTLASASADSTVRLWEVATGKEIRQFKGHRGEVHGASPDGKMLASGGADKTLRRWEVDTGKELRQLGKHQGAVKAIAFSPDGKCLALGGFGDPLRLWDLTTAQGIGSFQGSPDWVGSVVFCPDGKTLV